MEQIYKNSMVYGGFLIIIGYICNMKRNLLTIILYLAALTSFAQPIDREEVVRRNNPHVTSLDTLASLTVGNGGFAFTVDATGLQSFPRLYSNGVPLGTMSDWGWHSFDNPENYRPEEALKAFDFGHGHTEFYATQFNEKGRAQGAANWYRQNPHRMHLGAIGLQLDPDSVSDIIQTLDLWTGIIDSWFSYHGHRYHVQTVCHPERDMIATRIVSSGEKTLRLVFPYPTGNHSDDGCNWDEWEKNITSFEGLSGCHTDTLRRVLDGQSRFDDADYFVALNWSEGHRNYVNTNGDVPQWNINLFHVADTDTTVSLTCEFFERKDPSRPLLTFDDVAEASRQHWRDYWLRGAIVDFSHCTDPRAKELERRVVLSQYLLAVNDAGDTPPQETGLTYNSWFGKFHLEMIWWHQAQFALWGHPELLEHSLDWYFSAEPMAREIAHRQGFEGVRWMKMTDPSAAEAPSKVGSFLIWQQPHPIYLAELLYRASDSLGKARILEKYSKIVDETATFMASFATYDRNSGRYVLKGCIPAQETLRADETINPPFELSYWRYGLLTAQQWRERQQLPHNSRWDEVIDQLSALAMKDSLYLAAETAPQTYTDIRFTSDHMAVLGAVGVLPMTPQADSTIMRNTLHWVLEHWNWDKTWGWDFPMTAMNAARMSEPHHAVDALLMPQRTNTYLANGHNYQDQRLRIYLPGNGGLLTAVAMMCAGWDGSPTPNPGFPADGQWDVRWEGLLPLP